eukprot:TRINITY_DN62121_c0_g1_i1.p1 TRINITY_DN62121_c0_g1~~TRINITY_DN62121_c0_g1_i1.p1  ORF type:complete len:472 (-),score=38.78 TRINITY_DN62121_c0_g1_i1:169-1584(-)
MRHKLGVFFFFFQAEDGIRDAQESRGLGDVYKRQVINSVQEQSFKLFAADKLVEILAEQQPNNPNVRLDFVLLSMLAGNDYLPKLRCVQLQEIWPLYASECKHLSLLSPDGTFSDDFFWFMGVVANALPRNEVTRTRPQNVDKYLQALLWNVDMYVNGQCPDVEFALSRFAPAPSPREIADWFKNQSRQITVPKSETPWLTVSECLLALTPRAAEELLPQALQPLMRDESLSDLYKDEHCLTCRTKREDMRTMSTQIHELNTHVKATKLKANLSGVQKDKEQPADSSESKVFINQEEPPNDNPGPEASAGVAQELRLLRADYTRCSQEYLAHRQKEHCDPIPWEAIQSLAATVPSQEFSVAELQQVSAADSKYFWNSRRGGQNTVRSNDLCRMRKLPKPPVKSWTNPLTPKSLFVGNVVRPLRQTRQWCRSFGTSSPGEPNRVWSLNACACASTRPKNLHFRIVHLSLIHI